MKLTLKCPVLASRLVHELDRFLRILKLLLHCSLLLLLILSEQLLLLLLLLLLLHLFSGRCRRWGGQKVRSLWYRPISTALCSRNHRLLASWISHWSAPHTRLKWCSEVKRSVIWLHITLQDIKTCCMLLTFNVDPVDQLKVIRGWDFLTWDVFVYLLLLLLGLWASRLLFKNLEEVVTRWLCCRSHWSFLFLSLCLRLIPCVMPSPLDMIWSSLLLLFWVIIRYWKRVDQFVIVSNWPPLYWALLPLPMILMWLRSTPYSDDFVWVLLLWAEVRKLLGWVKRRWRVILVFFVRCKVYQKQVVKWCVMLDLFIKIPVIAVNHHLVLLSQIELVMEVHCWVMECLQPQLDKLSDFLLFGYPGQSWPSLLWVLSLGWVYSTNKTITFIWWTEFTLLRKDQLLDLLPSQFVDNRT